MRRSFIVLAVTLLVVPTLFPWYLLWLLPLAAVVGRRPSWAFILLTGLVVFLYTFYISIQAYWWTPLAEYVPFYVALAVEYRQWRRTQGPPQPGDRSWLHWAPRSGKRGPPIVSQDSRAA